MNRVTLRTLRSLYACFFKIGLTTFGGGLAMLPMLQREVVQRHAWVTEAEVLDCYAISRCTPGVVAVNTATYVGYRTGRVPGGVIATLGLVTPSIVIITILALFLRGFAEYSAVQHALAGIRVAVCVLSLLAVVRLYRSGVKGAFANAVLAVSLLLCLLLPVSPVWLVLGAVALGVGLELVRGWRRRA